MSFYDIVMIVLFVGAVAWGLWKGLAWQVACIASIFISYFVAMKFRAPVSEYIQAEEPWNKIGAMLLLFLGTSLLIWIVFGRVKETIKKFHLKTFDRQVGAVVGAATGALLCMVVTMFSVTLLGDSAKAAIFNSKTGGYITYGIDQLTTVVPDEIHDVIKPQLDKYYQAMGNDGSQPGNDPNSGFGHGYPAQPVGYGGQNGQQLNGYNGTFQPYQPQNTYGSGQFGQPNTGQQYGQPNGQYNQGTFNGQTGFPNQYQGRVGGYNNYQNQNSVGNNQSYTYPNQSPANNQAGSYNTNAGQGGDEFQWPNININTKDLFDSAINSGLNRVRQAIEENTGTGGNN